MPQKNTDHSTHLQTLLNVSPHAMILATIDGTILALNQQAANIFQQPIHTIIGQNGYNLIEHGPGERRRQILHKMITTKKPQILQDYERNRYWQTHFIPIIHNNQPITHFAVIIQDLTKNPQQQRIEYNDEFWERLLQYSTNIFTIIDKNGIVRYNSPNNDPHLPTIKPGTLYTEVLPFLKPKDQTKIKKALQHVFTKAGVSPPIQYQIKDTTGKHHYFESQANNLLDHPIIQGIIITTRNITPQKQKDTIIQHTQEYYKTILDNAPNMFFTLTKNLIVKEWNLAAHHATGYKKEDVIKKPFQDLEFIINRQEFSKKITTKTKQHSPKTLKIITKQGANKLFSIKHSTLKDAENKIIEYLFTGSDITPSIKTYGYLELGKSYLSIDNHLKNDLYTIQSLPDQYTHRLFITRTYPTTEHIIIQQLNIPIKRIGDTIHTITDLYTYIKKYCNTNPHPIILLDRIDYFVIMHSFKEVLKTLYDLNMIIHQYEGVLLIRLSSKILTAQQLALLEEEFTLLDSAPQKELYIEQDLEDILKYIHILNEKKVYITYKMIQDKFKISKLTTQKRLEQLMQMGLIYTEKSGRTKRIFFSHKGFELMLERQLV